MAATLNVSVKTIYYWVTRNEIPYVRVGRHLRFNSQHVMKFFEERTAESLPACLQTAASINLQMLKSRSLETKPNTHHVIAARKD